TIQIISITFFVDQILSKKFTHKYLLDRVLDRGSYDFLLKFCLQYSCLLTPPSVATFCGAECGLIGKAFRIL
ncbi:hypothetical protein, partial [Okeania sp. SIO3B5]|uniref:hypothetical protein n=1 Tax=Okeania sp. SIO3B5 TaxID=2607811 RepID=UPI0025F0BB76